MSRRKKNSNFKAVSIVFLLLLVGSFIGVLYVLEVNSGPDVSVVGCPVDETYINKNIAILFDTTEPMIPSQAKEIENRMSSLISGLEVFDRVSFYEVRSDETSAVRKVSLQLGSQSTTIDHFCRQQTSWEDSPARVRLSEELPKLISQEMFENLLSESLFEQEKIQQRASYDIKKLFEKRKNYNLSQQQADYIYKILQRLPQPRVAL